MTFHWTTIIGLLAAICMTGSGAQDIEIQKD